VVLSGTFLDTSGDKPRNFLEFERLGFQESETIPRNTSTCNIRCPDHPPRTALNSTQPKAPAVPHNSSFGASELPPTCGTSPPVERLQLTMYVRADPPMKEYGCGPETMSIPNLLWSTPESENMAGRLLVPFLGVVPRVLAPQRPALKSFVLPLSSTVRSFSTTEAAGGIVVPQCVAAARRVRRPLSWRSFASL
jgi:hypothetical protein